MSRRAESVIPKMDDIGKIWLQNDKQKRQNKRLKRKSMRQISQYQKDLDRLGRICDEGIVQIKKNIQKDRVDRARREFATQATVRLN